MIECKHRKLSGLLVIALAVCMMLTMMPWLGGNSAYADTDITSVNVSGTYDQTAARFMLAMINSFRTGSDAWYWNDGNQTKTTLSDLKAYTYDYNLEKIAMQRAAEAAVNFDHTRPDKTNCATCQYNGTTASGESIACGNSTAAATFAQLQEADDTYANQGHRRNMLESQFTSIGIAHFKHNGCDYWVQEFGDKNSGAAQTDANDNQATVPVNVVSSALSNIKATTASIDIPFSGSNNYGDTIDFPVVSATSTYSSTKSVADVTVNNVTWSAADSSIADVINGKVVSKKAGETTISANVNGTILNVKVIVDSPTKSAQSIGGLTSSITKTVGDSSFNLGATASTALTYSSSDPSVATVDALGNVTVVGKGAAVITVNAAETSDFKGAASSVDLTVNPVPKAIQTISGLPTSITKTIGDEPFNLGAKASTALTYSSSDPNVAVVANDGEVCIFAAGTAVITVTAAEDDNYQSATANVNLTVNSVAKSSQTITGLTTDITKTVGDKSFNLNAKASTALTYSSSDPDVAIVTDEGEVCIFKAGTAVITVTAAESDSLQSATANVNLTVNSVAKAEQTISGLTTDITKTVGDSSFNLNAKASTALTYSSSDTSVATVDTDGNVKVVGAGKAVITVNAEETGDFQGATSNVNLTVNSAPKAAQTISGLTTDITKTVGDSSFNLGATAPNALTYSSSNPSVATVDAVGNVKVVGAGTAVITVNAAESDSLLSAKSSVNVTVNKAAQTITGLTTDITKTVGDKSFNLNATASTALTYSSSDTSVATVDTSGNVTVVGKGTAVITVNAAESDNYLSAKSTVNLTVNSAPKAAQTITGLTTDITKTVGDKSFNLNATASTALTYSSSDTSVATVDASGNVTVVGAGKAVITVNAAESDNFQSAKASVNLTVNSAPKAAQSITGLSTSITKTIGDSAFNLGAKASTALTYSSSDTSVAAVDAAGNVTVRGVGRAIITVNAAESGSLLSAKASVAITVAPVPKSVQSIKGIGHSISKTAGSRTFNLGATASSALSYLSSDPDIVEVDSNGNVTVKGPGRAVITINATENGSFLSTSASVIINIYPAKTTGLKLQTGKKKITASWKKDKSVSGYQLVYATDKKFSKSKKNVWINRYSTTSTVLKKLKSKNTYYVKIRALKSIGTQIMYGDYTTAVKVKVK